LGEVAASGSGAGSRGLAGILAGDTAWLLRRAAHQLVDVDLRLLDRRSQGRWMTPTRFNTCRSSAVSHVVPLGVVLGVVTTLGTAMAQVIALGLLEPTTGHDARVGIQSWCLALAVGVRWPGS
jgi:hypothetical protein